MSRSLPPTFPVVIARDDILRRVHELARAIAHAHPTQPPLLLAVMEGARVFADQLLFANGVAVGPDDAYVLVNETAAYRVMRYWLKGEKAGDNPWGGKTLEWTTASPPPHENFLVTPTVTAGPYEYR